VRSTNCIALVVVSKPVYSGMLHSAGGGQGHNQREPARAGVAIAARARRRRRAIGSQITRDSKGQSANMEVARSC
jgi:hypothetical protein